MSRSVPEWIGKTDDTKAPDSVRRRVYLKYEGVCQCECGRQILSEVWDLDHRKPLADGGENRESNLWPLLTAHHKNKTKAEATERAFVRRKQMRHIGIKRKPKGRPFATNKDQPFKKTMSGKVVRR